MTRLRFWVLGDWLADTFKTPAAINQKVYVIDDGDHCTMLLSEEY